MPFYYIPTQVINGFHLLSELSTGDAHRLAEILRNAPVGFGIKELLNPVDSELPTISKLDARELLTAIFSTIGLRIESLKEGGDFVSDFTESFAQVAKITDAKREQFQENLAVIVSGYGSIIKTSLARDAFASNANNYREASINTDVRPLVTDEGNDGTLSYAVLLHTLRLSSYSDNDKKEVYVTMDSEDVRKLKSVLDDAIRNEDRIKSVAPNVHFIDFTQ